MRLTEKQKEKLKKVLTKARGIGFGMFSLDPFYDKDAEKKVILEISYKDNFFEHKPNTYIVMIGGYIDNLKVIGEYRSIDFDILMEILGNY